MFKLPVRKFIVLFTLWQAISTFLIIVGIWPQEIIWLNVVISLVFIMFASTLNSVLILIASIPFFVVLPNQYLDSFSTWRVLVLALTAVWLMKRYFVERKSFKLNTFVVMPWDRYLGYFIVLALALVPFSSFPIQSLKLILFFINIYMLYFVLINILETKKQVIDVIKYTALSLTTIVALGYIQLLLTFFTSFEMFWKAWAIMVSKVYYGRALTEVLLYSNSWFSYTGGQSLRMFSIMPDSHAFALVSIFAVSFLLMLTYLHKKKKVKHKTQEDLMHTDIPIIHDPETDTVFGVNTNYWLWSAVRLAGLAVILSGTRAAWVGLLAPLVIVGWLIHENIIKPMAKKALWPLLIILVFFAMAPFINVGLNVIRFERFQEDFLDRAKTIADLSEDSNVGRLQMWKESFTFGVKHPFGVGLGNFISSLNENRSKDYNELASQHNKRFNLPQKYITAHSLYLQLFVEVGIVGLVLFLWFWWVYFKRVWTFIRHRSTDNNILLFFVLNTSLAFLWILAAAVFDVTLFNDKVLMYFFISLGITGTIVQNYKKFKEQE